MSQKKQFQSPAPSPAPSQNKPKNEPKNRAFVEVYDPIYKLALSGTKVPPQSPEKRSLLSRAKAKDFSYKLAVSLSNVPNSPLLKSYRNTLFCAWQIFKDGVKSTSRYCGYRWCLVCNRIRCAKLIKAYGPQLQKIENPYFVTLTIPNVLGHYLRPSIIDMKRNVSRICSKYKKRHQRGRQAWKIDGLLKIECTYNFQRNTFHPHFHLIVDGLEAAKALKKDWLKVYPACSAKGQDVRKAKPGSEKEMFKYFAKIVTPTETGWGVYVTAMDTIFTAMKGLNTFTNLGSIRPVSEEVECVKAEPSSEYQYGYSEYIPEIRDWVDTDTGELETGYVRSEALEKIINNFIQ